MTITGILTGRSPDEDDKYTHSVETINDNDTNTDSVN